MSQTVRIERVPRDKVPAGAKTLTEQEVFEHYFTLFQEWKPDSEAWPFKYGWMALGAVSCTANFFILKQYRQRLKLNHGLMAVLTIGCAIVPSLLAPIGHLWYVTKKIYVQDGCAGCLHVRSVGIQLLSVLGYALTVNPALCFMKAQQLATYNVPGYYTSEQRRKTWQLYLKFTKRAGGTIYTHALINSIVASAITANEITYFAKLQEKILQKNNEVDELKKTLPQ